MPYRSTPHSVAIESISIDWQWFLMAACLPFFYRTILARRKKRAPKNTHSLPKAHLTPNNARPFKYTSSVHCKMLDQEINRRLADQLPQFSAHRRATHSQIFFFASVSIALIAAYLFAPHATLTSIFYIYLLISCMIVSFKVYLFFGASQSSLAAHEKVDTIKPDKIITILCPLYRETNSLEHLLHALEQLDYPKNLLDVKILLEEDDKETIEKATYIFTADQYDLIILPPSHIKTKPRALNIGLSQAKGEYCVIYDAEDRPETDQLKKAIIHFANAPNNVACLQAKLNFYNANQNSLTRLFSLEYGLLFDFLIPQLAAGHYPIPLGGTSNFFKTDILKEIGGWDPYNVTEDADIGLRLHHFGYRSESLESTTWEEATHTILPWCRQRSRWIKGYIQTWLVHMRTKPANMSFAHTLRWYAVLHLFVGGNIFAALFNPIFWGVYLYFILTPNGTGTFFPNPALGIIATLIFLISNMILLYLYVLTPIKRRQFKLAICAVTFPLYWVLQSFAGYYALWQFFRKPFYWEKTPHFIDRDAE